LAACRCGAVGTPESLGWMGDTCGPCFDRRADGAPPTGGFGQYSGWSSALARFAFAPDGRFLVGPAANNSLRAVNRFDESAVQAKRKIVGYVAGLACDATATTVLYQDGTALRWEYETGETRALIGPHGTYGRGALAPDGSRAVFLSYMTSITVDLTAKRPEYARHDPALYTAVAFAPDGKRLFATAQPGALVELNPETLSPTVLRPDPFDAAPQSYTAPGDIAVAPDGSAVLLRRDQWQPRRSLVRHVPLSGGRVVDLRVPDWHRPTAMAYSRDGGHAVTADSEGGWVGFWDVASGKSLGYVRAVLEDLAWRCGQVEFAPDGSAVAVSYNTGHHEHGSTLAVWPWPDVLRAAALSAPAGDEPTEPRAPQPEG
jgi:sugar lactone lactonase YvrE